MNKYEAERAKLIKFIYSNDPFYAFANFEWHSMEQLEKIKQNIDREIKATAETNKQNKKILNP